MKKIKLLDVSLIALPIVIYGLLVSHTIGKWSIWFDEAFSAYLVRFDVAGIFHYTSADVHPPLYYVFLKFWTMVFGTSDIALRSLSAVFIAAAIVVMYLFLKSIFGRQVAFGSAMLLAVSPLLIRFGQEARMYGMVVLIAVIATWVLYSAHQNPTRKKWITYAVLVALGMWTHYFTAVVWLSHWAWRFIVTWQKNQSLNQRLKRFLTPAWVKTHLLAVGLFLPWLPFMVIQLGQIQGNGFWIRAVDADTFTDYVTTNLLYLEHYEAQSWLAVLTLGVIGLTAWLYTKLYRDLNRSEQKGLLLITAIAVAGPVLLFVASLPPLRPSFVDRYLLAASFFMMATVGVVGMLALKKFRIGSVVLGTLLIASVAVGIGNVYDIGNFNRESWETMAMKEVISAINENDATDAPIVADTAWRFYEATQYETNDHKVYFFDKPVPFGSYNMLRDHLYRKITDTNKFFSEHPEFWYIVIAHDDAPRMPAGEWQVIDSVKGPQTIKDSGTAYAYKLRPLQSFSEE